MEIRVGEKVTGVVDEIGEEGYVISLCNGVTGIAEHNNLIESVSESDIDVGTEAKVRVDNQIEKGRFHVTLMKLYSGDNFQEKPDKYLKNVSHEKQNGDEKAEEPEISDELEEWFSEVDETLEEVRENRKERLNVDFWTV
ncbi:MAG: hypothetical protein ACLFN7_03190 [Candidatus Acetothermia bacterium]